MPSGGNVISYARTALEVLVPGLGSQYGIELTVPDVRLITPEDTAHGTYGVWKPESMSIWGLWEDDCIAVAEGLSRLEAMATAAHELGHLAVNEHSPDLDSPFCLKPVSPGMESLSVDTSWMLRYHEGVAEHFRNDGIRLLLEKGLIRREEGREMRRDASYGLIWWLKAALSLEPWPSIERGRGFWFIRGLRKEGAPMSQLVAEPYRYLPEQAMRIYTS